MGKMFTKGMLVKIEEKVHEDKVFKNDNDDKHLNKTAKKRTIKSFVSEKMRG
jgi:hypothetical protein